MRDLLDAFLHLPIGIRATIVSGTVFLLYWIFAGLVLRILSIIPWLLLKLTQGLYQLLEIPVSALHKLFGNAFAWLDRGLTSFAESACGFFERLHKRMKQPKTVFRGTAFLVTLVLCAHFLIPVFADLTERPFVFWQDAFVERESAVIVWLEYRGVFGEASLHEYREVFRETPWPELGEGEIHVTIDGVRQPFAVSARLIDGNSMLPLSCFADSLGISLTFFPDDTVSLTTAGITGIHEIGTNEITINGEISALTSPSIFIDGDVFVPVRMLADIVGADVEWNGTLQAVIITTSQS